MGNAIITGASGFIGFHLCKILNDKGIKTYAVLRNETSHYDELKSFENIIPVICDLDQITSLPRLIPEASIDVLYHLAWGGVSGRDRGNYHIQLKNIKITLELITAVSELNCKRFVGVGSTAEYDAYNACEADGVSPDIVGLYGTSKLTVHFMSKILCRSLGMEHIWGNIGNTFGVGDKSNNFINFASKRILSKDEAKFTSGEQNYDFVYVTDVAEAIYCLGSEGKDKCSYYIGSGNPRQLKEYIVALRDQLNPEKELQLGAIPYNGISAPIESFSIEKIKRDTGFVPKVSFEEGINNLKTFLKETE